MTHAKPIHTGRKRPADLPDETKLIFEFESEARGLAETCLAGKPRQMNQANSAQLHGMLCSQHTDS